MSLIEEVGIEQSGFGYTGQQMDANSGLVYLRARYYDPLTGRFINKDPFPGLPTLSQTQNPYPYTLNNPINHTDPSSELVDVAFDIAFAGFNAGSLVYHTYQWWHECDPRQRRDLQYRMGVDAGALFLDLSFIFIPGATGGGAMYRGGRYALAHGGVMTVAKAGRAALETVKAARWAATTRYC